MRESREGWRSADFFHSICVVLVQMQLQLPKKSQQQRKEPAATPATEEPAAPAATTEEAPKDPHYASLYVDYS